MNRPPKRLLGRRELVDFPAFALTDVEAKVDTGAYTSAIHCANIRIEADAEQRAVLMVHLLDPGHDGADGHPLTFTEFASARHPLVERRGAGTVRYPSRGAAVRRKF
jgi:hypothetical protein